MMPAGDLASNMRRLRSALSTFNDHVGDLNACLAKHDPSGLPTVDVDWIDVWLASNLLSAEPASRRLQ